MVVYFPRKRHASGRSSWAVSKRTRTGRTYMPRKYRGYFRTQGAFRNTTSQYGRAGGGRNPAGGNAEWKWLDTAANSVNIASTGVLVQDSLNIVPSGTGPSERIGRKITIRSINGHMNFFTNLTDAQPVPSPGVFVRLILVLDSQANGTNAIVSGIGGILVNADVLEHLNLNNSQRYRVLMDKYVTINPTNMASDGAGVVSSAALTAYRSFYKRCNIPVEFNADSGLMATIRSNNLGMIAISSVGGVDSITLESNWRIRYTDA